MIQNVPELTEDIIDFLNSKNIWYNITYNLEANSCADAANKRSRLGNIGIPLHDELKSSIGYYYKENKRTYVLIHYRGNQLLDEVKVNNLLNSNYTKLSSEELISQFNCEYGLVNPFYFASKFPDIIQIFDHSLFQKHAPPYTIMTNACDKNWGIEIKPEDILKITDNNRIEDIVKEAHKTIFKKQKIGILTGNSPGSGIFLWRKINKTIRTESGRNFMGDLSLPDTLVHSVPEMGLSMELDIRYEEIKNIIETNIRSLCESGVTIIGVACNTTQYFSDIINNICSEYDVQFVSMEEAVESYLRKNQISHFDFIGIKYVVDFEKWSGYKKLLKNYHVELPSDKDLQKINDIAFEVKKNHISPRGINKIRDLINNSTKTNNIIIALTEISLLLETQKKRKSKKHLVDTLSILGESMARIFLEKTRGLNSENT